jgi:hypothetical protein
MAITRDGKTGFVASWGNGTVSTIDVKTRTQDPNRHPRRHDPVRTGDHAVSPVTGNPTTFCEAWWSLAAVPLGD